MPDGFKAQLAEPAERGQVNTGEARIRGSVVLVEVFRRAGAGTSVLGMPRGISRDRRASSIPTLIWERPLRLFPDEGVVVLRSASARRSLVRVEVFRGWEF
jgi:hypothetical protein